MVKSLSKVIYKPDPNSTDEYTIIVNPDDFKKWKDGDTTIPLANVVDSFQVFFSNQGSQGILGAPSKQQLDNIFGTHRDDEVVKKILEKGRMQAGDGIAQGPGSLNDARGSFAIDSRGGRNTSGI